MTYCVGLLIDAGIVCLSDTRTNAGLDNIAIYRKMFTYEEPGERAIIIMTAGSLSVTQTTIARIDEAIYDLEPSPRTSIMLAPTVLQVAQIVGRNLAEVTKEIRERVGQSQVDTGASFLVAGQRAGGAMRMFLIYPAGNFIEATEDTPFLQIGEHKYGKPILDRVISNDTALVDAKKAALLSMASTLRSNLSVGMPLDMAVIAKDAMRVTERRRIEDQDPTFLRMSADWSDALRNAFAGIEI